ncbi:phage tail tube protein [Sphingomonas sp. R86521]|uniref:phage tail tube protein n=1 Tax=Sphingomonas sp. R86521 TaxID=3093860 RepID=UPI0036D218DD
MGRARGANAAMNIAFETTYGTPPATGYRRMPFVSADIGAERGLIESDLLGQGRNPFDPSPDVTNNDGNVVVAVDELFFGHWLKLLLGAPVTIAGNGQFLHTFDSGAAALPSLSAELAFPDVPSFSTNYGLRGSTMQLSAQRSGLLNATIGLIGRGETVAAATSAITTNADIADVIRLAQMSGDVTIDGAHGGVIVAADMSFSNSLEKIEAIRPDGEIEDADAGMPMASGSVTIAFDNNALPLKASSNTPVSLEMRWASVTASLTLQFGRVFLPRRKKQVSGPKGIQVKYDWIGSGEGQLPLFRALLLNKTPSYA